MKKPTRLLAFVYILGLIAFFIICTLFTGCSKAWYQQRDIKRLDTYAVQQPAEFARLSNWLLPCFNGKAKSDTVTVFGPGDTVRIAGKIVIKNVHDTIYSTQYDTLKITKTVNHWVHDTVPDTRQTAALQSQLTTCSSDRDKFNGQITQLQKDKDAADKKANVRFWIIVALGAVIVGYGVWEIYKLVTGGSVVDVVKKVI